MGSQDSNLASKDFGVPTCSRPFEQKIVFRIRHQPALWAPPSRKPARRGTRGGSLTPDHTPYLCYLGIVTDLPTCEACFSLLMWRLCLVSYVTLVRSGKHGMEPLSTCALLHKSQVTSRVAAPCFDHHLLRPAWCARFDWICCVRTASSPFSEPHPVQSLSYPHPLGCSCSCLLSLIERSGTCGRDAH